jgi:hypothetical protein
MRTVLVKFWNHFHPSIGRRRRRKIRVGDEKGWGGAAAEVVEIVGVEVDVNGPQSSHTVGGKPD